MDTLSELLSVFFLEMDINQRTEDGETLLHLVAKQGKAEYIEELVNCGVDLAIQDDTGNTFLHDLAEQCGNDAENSEVKILNI